MEKLKNELFGRNVFCENCQKTYWCRIDSYSYRVYDHGKTKLHDTRCFAVCPECGSDIYFEEMAV